MKLLIFLFLISGVYATKLPVKQVLDTCRSTENSHACGLYMLASVGALIKEHPALFCLDTTWDKNTWITMFTTYSFMLDKSTYNREMIAGDVLRFILVAHHSCEEI